MNRNKRIYSVLCWVSLGILPSCKNVNSGDGEVKDLAVAQRTYGDNPHESSYTLKSKVPVIKMVDSNVVESECPYLPGNGKDTESYYGDTISKILRKDIDFSKCQLNGPKIKYVDLENYIYFEVVNSYTSIGKSLASLKETIAYHKAQQTPCTGYSDFHCLDDHFYAWYMIEPEADTSETAVTILRNICNNFDHFKAKLKAALSNDTSEYVGVVSHQTRSEADPERFEMSSGNADTDFFDLVYATVQKLQYRQDPRHAKFGKVAPPKLSKGDDRQKVLEFVRKYPTCSAALKVN